MAFRTENLHCQLRLSDHLVGARPYREFDAELQRRHLGLEVFDPTPVLCDASLVLCLMTQGKCFLYSYSDHFSDHAISVLAQYLGLILQRLAPLN